MPGCRTRSARNSAISSGTTSTGAKFEEQRQKLIADGVETPVVMISGHADIDTAVDCIKKGAFDFIGKPLDLNRILITIKNATDKANLVTQTKILKKKVYGQEI